MMYRIPDYENSCLFESWALSYGIDFELLDDGNYLDACPECGDSEFWHGGHCSHCGYDAR